MRNNVKNNPTDRKIENLIVTFNINETPIDNNSNYVMLYAEIYRSEDVSDCITKKIYMGMDMYLDLLIEKNKVKDIADGDGIYFSSNILGNLDAIDENTELDKVITDGVLAIYNEEKQESLILKEIV